MEVMETIGMFGGHHLSTFRLDRYETVVQSLIPNIKNWLLEIFRNDDPILQHRPTPQERETKLGPILSSIYEGVSRISCSAGNNCLIFHSPQL